MAGFELVSERPVRVFAALVNSFSAFIFIAYPCKHDPSAGSVVGKKLSLLLKILRGKVRDSSYSLIVCRQRCIKVNFDAYRQRLQALDKVGVQDLWSLRMACNVAEQKFQNLTEHGVISLKDVSPIQDHVTALECFGCKAA